jgi:hypothetical protein
VWRPPIGRGGGRFAILTFRWRDLLAESRPRGGVAATFWGGASLLSDLRESGRHYQPQDPQKVLPVAASDPSESAHQTTTLDWKGKGLTRSCPPARRQAKRAGRASASSKIHCLLAPEVGFSDRSHPSPRVVTEDDSRGLPPTVYCPVAAQHACQGRWKSPGGTGKLFRDVIPGF